MELFLFLVLVLFSFLFSFFYYYISFLSCSHSHNKSLLVASVSSQLVYLLCLTINQIDTSCYHTCLSMIFNLNSFAIITVLILSYYFSHCLSGFGSECYLSYLSSLLLIFTGMPLASTLAFFCSVCLFGLSLLNGVMFLGAVMFVAARNDVW